MRFDTPVYFQRITPGVYDPSTGNHLPDTVTETLRYASVTDSKGMPAAIGSGAVYGDVNEDRLIIRIKGQYTAAFDRIRIGSVLYVAKEPRKLRRFTTLTATAMQKGAGINGS